MDSVDPQPILVPLPEAEERRLAERLKAGEEAAYDEVTRVYGPQLLAVCQRFLRHEQDAQDAVQDALLRAFKGIDDFEGRAKLGTWLHRIAINSALAKLRNRRRRDAEQSIDDLLPNFSDEGRIAEPVQPWSITPERAVADREIRQLVRRVIDELPEAYRVVLLLRDIEGQSTEDSAAALGIRAGALKTRLHRARQALRTRLDHYFRKEAS